MLTRPIDGARLRRVAASFSIPGDYAGAVPYGTGHINDTFAVTFDQGGTRVRYILQRINDAVFPSPLAVMENIERVVAHLRQRIERLALPQPSRRVLSLVTAGDGKRFHADDDGHVWRCYLFIEGARSHDIITTPDRAYQGALAFGRFHSLLADYPGPRLHDTIPRFHHTAGRVHALIAAVEHDECDRAAASRGDIDFALSRRALADTLLDLHAAAVIPERITHNDTKLNNILFDDATGEGICVLDLDTVMPGLSLYDFGDMVRTATSLVAEDHPDLTAIHVRPEMFAALVRGYIEGTVDTLLPVERDHLVTAGKLLTYECGVRFLTDHLRGDVYFRIHHDGHNLQRARAQFALLRSLEEHEDDLDRIVREVAGG